MRFIYLSLLFVATLSSASEEPGAATADAELEKLIRICETALCRTQPLTMTSDELKPFALDFDIAHPYVQDDSVTIFPGDELFVEFTVKDGQLVDLVAVPKLSDPTRTLIVRMWQEVGKADTYLKVTNPLPELVKYHAAMMPLTEETLSETSSCPVLGNGRMAFEHWPQAVFQLVLFDFHTVAESSHLVCEF